MMSSASKCPCGNDATLTACCGRFLDGQAVATSPEELMRSRYSAFALERVDYLVETTWPESRSKNLAAELHDWMDVVQWIGLHILDVDDPYVEFVAEYISEGRMRQHHERSLFRNKTGRWYYVPSA